MHSKNELSERYDDLIVGAGSAGAVLAARLSEDSSRRVLLLESGPDQPSTETMTHAIRNANQVAIVPGLNWKISMGIKGHGVGSSQPARGAASLFDYEAGRVVGGSSAINAVQALRGVPQDFSAWANECGEDWSWAAVLPYYRLLEDDPVGSDSLHGRRGPMPIRRERKEDLTPLQAGLMDACIAQGFAETDDHNDPGTTGVGIIPKNVVDGVRMSTALTYLAMARARKNLHIVADAHVHRIAWSGSSSCEGVDAEVDGVLKRFRARRVIICAGAMNTPGILMRSGLGLPGSLESLGIKTHLPLVGVGENLMDHPVVGIWGVPKQGVCTPGEPLRQTLLRYTSACAGSENDMHICMMAGMDARAMFPSRVSASSLTTIAGITACFNKSTSHGQVRIVSADPYAKPQATLNCLGNKADVPPLKEGVRLAWKLLHHAGLRPLFDQILAWTDDMVRSDIALERAVTAFVRPGAHICGSARMGRTPEQGAVVDPQGRVFGTDNLWIADASIMPTIPSAPTHLTALMVAEKIAAGLKKMDVCL